MDMNQSGNLICYILFYFCAWSVVQIVVVVILAFRPLTALWHTALCYTKLLHTILNCYTLYYTILLYTATVLPVLYTTLYYTTVHCTVLHCTVLHCTILYSNIIYDTILRRGTQEKASTGGGDVLLRPLPLRRHHRYGARGQEPGAGHRPVLHGEDDGAWCGLVWRGVV